MSVKTLFRSCSTVSSLSKYSLLLVLCSSYTLRVDDFSSTDFNNQRGATTYEITKQVIWEVLSKFFYTDLLFIFRGIEKS